MKDRRKHLRKAPTPMSLKETSELVAILKTAFRDVVVKEKNGKVIIVARDHFPMQVRPGGSCYCGGEVKPVHASVKNWQRETYSTEGAS